MIKYDETGKETHCECSTIFHYLIANERKEKASMRIYNHCEYRNSWDCEDGWCDCKNCGHFKLDFDTLTEKQKKAVKRILSNQDEEE